jgi:putative endonuclease
LNFSKDIGYEGEAIAAVYLEQAGCVILKRNFTSKYGEIDIIAQDKDTLVFVEVKSFKQGSLLDPLEAITPSKIKKLLKTARYYFSCFHSEEPPSRFDVITVRGDKVEKHLVGAISN